MMSFMSFFETSEHSIGWLAVLFDASVKSVIVLALAAGLNLTLKHSSAAFRHLIWLLAVVSCLCLPVISVTLPSWRLPVGPQTLSRAEATPDFERNLNVSQLPTSDHQVATSRVLNPQVDPNYQTAGSLNAIQETSANSASQASGWRTMSTLWTCIGIAWVIGMLIVITPLLAGLVGIWRIAGRSRRITDGSLAALADELVGQLGIKRRVTLLRSEVEMPLTWGIIRPQILIPADAKNWSTDQQRAVLLHELAHIQRWDWLTQTIAQISCAIYWFNPLVWVADRRMRLERERACDDHVLTNGCAATDYASHLLEIARTSRPPVFAARAAVAMAQPSWIEKRLRVILATDRNRNPVTKASVTVSVLAVACLVLLIGAMRPAEAVEEEELLQQIRETVLGRPEPSEKPPSPPEMEAMMEQFTKRIENAFELSEQFLGAYPDSKKRDEVWMYKIQCLLGLDRHGEANAEMEAFLKVFPKSKHTMGIWTIKIGLLEREGKYKEALAELDKIDHPAMLPKVYEQKANLYSMMQEWEKAAEYRLRAAEMTLGKPAPDFNLKDIYGETVSLKGFRGKVVLLDFWATWCGPCIDELPTLKAIHEKHKHNTEFALISISADANDETVAKFVEKNKMPWIHIREIEEMQAKFNVISIPHYTIIDRNGLIREDKLHGGVEIDAALSSLLAEAPSEPDSANIAKLHELRAELHNRRGEREQAIAEFEQALRLQPNNLRLISAISDWYEAGTSQGDSQIEKALAFHNESLPKLVKSNQSKTGADFILGLTAFGFAKFYGKQGDAEKCWQAFQIAMKNDLDGVLAKEAKRSTGTFSAIRHESAFEAFTETAPETEQDRRRNEMLRKHSEFGNERVRARQSFAPVSADGEIFTGVILNSTGLLLVPDIVADAANIRAKITDYQAAHVVARDSRTRLAVIKVEGAKNLRPVEMGTVEDLKEYAPYGFKMTNGSTDKAFGLIALITARAYSGTRDGQITDAYEHVISLEIDTAGNITSCQIGAWGRSPLSDALVHYNGKLLGVCVDDEVVHKASAHDAPRPKYNVVPIDQIGASLERMGMTDMLGN